MNMNIYYCWKPSNDIFGESRFPVWMKSLKQPIAFDPRFLLLRICHSKAFRNGDNELCKTCILQSDMHSYGLHMYMLRNLWNKS